MKNEIEQQLVSLKEELNTLETQVQDLYDQRNSSVKEVIEPLFKEYGVLQFDSYLAVSDKYLYIQREKVTNEGKFFGKEDLVYLRIEDNKIHKNFYSTTDSSTFEFERMVVIGKVGEMVLKSGDTLLEVFDNVFRSYSELIREVYNSIAKIKGDIRTRENNLREMEKDEFIRLLRNGVEFNNDRFVTLQVKANKSVDITSLHLLDTKGKSAYIKYRSRYSGIEMYDTIRFINILEFVESKSNRNSVITVEEVVY